jgi:phosphoglycolate phosphatase-like HAD superfamily hydrolase
MGGLLDCTPANVVHVGNEQKDMDVAKAFGCPAILLKRGGPQVDWGQSRTINLLSEL